MSDKAVAELTAPTTAALTYNARYNYIEQLVRVWSHTRVPIKLIASNFKSNNVSLSDDDIKPWTHNEKTTTVWDININSNHAIVAICLPNKQLHVLDPIVGNRFRALSIAERIRQKCNIEDIALKPHHLPDHALDIASDADPNGVCTLWCCLMVNCAIVGIDWENDICPLEEQELRYALVHAQRPPRTMITALESIPNEVQGRRRSSCINRIQWSHPRHGILEPGTYYHLYECELSFKDLQRADWQSRRVENSFGEYTLEVFIAHCFYTASAFIDLCQS